MFVEKTFGDHHPERGAADRQLPHRRRRWPSWWRRLSPCRAGRGDDRHRRGRSARPRRRPAVTDRAVGPRLRRHAHRARTPTAATGQAACRRSCSSGSPTAGLWAPFLPPRLGGAGMDMVTLGEVHEEVGRGCSSVRSLLTVHTMVAWAVQRWGTAAQRERWMPRPGQRRGARRVLPLRARRRQRRHGDHHDRRRAGDGWVLNGVKKWITGGQRADLFLVFARTGRQHGAFLVPRDAPGVTVTPDPRHARHPRLDARRDHLRRRAGSAPDALLGPRLRRRHGAHRHAGPGPLQRGGRLASASSRPAWTPSPTYAARRTVGGSPLRDQQLIRRS